MDKRELSAALAAIPEWRWMRGMVATVAELGEWLVLEAEPGRIRLFDGSKAFWWSIQTLVEHARPDYDDPATAGCLVALAEEAFGVKVDMSLRSVFFDEIEATAWTRPDDEGNYENFDGRGATRGEAIARLLLALSQARAEGRL